MSPWAHRRIPPSARAGPSDASAIAAVQALSGPRSRRGAARRGATATELARADLGMAGVDRCPDDGPGRVIVAWTTTGWSACSRGHPRATLI